MSQLVRLEGKHTTKMHIVQWQPVDNEDKALALHSDVLNFQTLGEEK